MSKIILHDEIRSCLLKNNGLIKEMENAEWKNVEFVKALNELKKNISIPDYIKSNKNIKKIILNNLKDIYLIFIPQECRTKTGAPSIFCHVFEEITSFPTKILSADFLKKIKHLKFYINNYVLSKEGNRKNTQLCLDCEMPSKTTIREYNNFFEKANCIRSNEDFLNFIYFNECDYDFLKKEHIKMFKYKYEQSKKMSNNNLPSYNDIITAVRNIEKKLSKANSSQVSMNESLHEIFCTTKYFNKLIQSLNESKTLENGIYYVVMNNNKVHYLVYNYTTIFKKFEKIEDAIAVNIVLNVIFQNRKFLDENEIIYFIIIKLCNLKPSYMMSYKSNEICTNILRQLI